MTMVDVESGKCRLLGGVIIINGDGGCGKRQAPVAEGDKNSSQLSVLRRDHTSTHLRSEDLAADRCPATSAYGYLPSDE